MIYALRVWLARKILPKSHEVRFAPVRFEEKPERWLRAGKSDAGLLWGHLEAMRQGKVAYSDAMVDAASAAGFEVYGWDPKGGMELKAPSDEPLTKMTREILDMAQFYADMANQTRNTELDRVLALEFRTVATKLRVIARGR